MTMRTAILLAILMVAACSPDQPFDRPGTWSLGSGPSSNELNLRAMVVNPHDLVQGQSANDSLGAEAAPPVARLLSGRRTPLPSSDTTELQSGSQAQPSAPAPNGGP
jgi:hypothetical protein